MENRNEIVDEVNKLIEINNDRIEGYERAVKETNDESLKSRFTNYALQSRKFKSELTGFVTANGGKPTEGTTTSGKFFRAWMDFKSAIALKDKKTIVGSCEFGEDAALDVYNEVSDKTTVFPENIRTKITEQKNELQKAHDSIRELRDSLVDSI